MRQKRGTRILVVFALALGFAGCQHGGGADTQPLNQSGMDYDSVKQLEQLKITKSEVADILAAHDAGFSDTDCVRIVQIFHGRGQLFNAGSTVAGLIQAGIGDQTILDLANLNQLGFAAGEFEAMRLAGLSDEIILEIARHRSQGKPVLSGATLARLKNTGMRGSTLLELSRRNIPDSEGAQILSLRRSGASDSQILRRFSGS